MSSAELFVIVKVPLPLLIVIAPPLVADPIPGLISIITSAELDEVISGASEPENVLEPPLFGIAVLPMSFSRISPADL